MTLPEPPNVISFDLEESLELLAALEDSKEWTFALLIGIGGES